MVAKSPNAVREEGAVLRIRMAPTTHTCSASDKRNRRAVVRMLGARSSSTICSTKQTAETGTAAERTKGSTRRSSLLPSSKMDSTCATKNREAIPGTDSRKAYTPRPARSRTLLHCTTDSAAVLPCLHWLSTFAGLKSEALLPYNSSSIALLYNSSIYSTQQ